MPDKHLKVLGICGSLRKGSFNHLTLVNAQKLVPEGMTIEIANIHEIPLYNEDVKALGFPPAVQTFRDQIQAADALLFATPEYNYSISGVLKNAIDWASRPPNHPFDGKAVGIVGAAGGIHGTARAQYHLRQCCIFLNMLPINKPEVFIGQAQTKFDAEGNLGDEVAKGLIKDLLKNLGTWTRRLQATA